MTKWLCIDTETTGLPAYNLPADHPSQPFLCELAMIRLDEDLSAEREDQFYIKPDGWTVAPEVVEVHGLTTEFLEEFGKPVKLALDAYTEAIREGRAVMAYGARFDCKMMRATLRRAQMDDLFMITKNACVMDSCRPLKIKKASGKGGQPKLSDACAHFGIVQPEEHGALDDARAAAEIARCLRNLQLLKEPEVHFAKDHPLGKGE